MRRSRSSGATLNLARGELTVGKSKTDAGVRVIDLTPRFATKSAVWLDKQSSKQPTALVFPNKRGLPDNRHNVSGRRLFEPAIEKANKRLAELGIEQIGKVTPHGLRRTYASLRCAAGDDPAFTSAQLGHEDAGFTLRVYTHAVKRRERLSTNERAEYDRALEWASWGATFGHKCPIDRSDRRRLDRRRDPGSRIGSRFPLDRDGRIRTAGLLLPKQAR